MDIVDFALELYEQCGFWNCMDSGDFALELYEQCGFWNCIDSVDFVLELHGQCGFCFAAFHFIYKTKKNKTKTEHDMCWTPIFASKHK